MNIKQIITVGVAGMAMGAMALDNVEVTDVKARQRYPWNGKVDIDFTLDSKATEPYQMLVEVYDNIGKTNLPVKSVCTEGLSFEENPTMVREDTRRIIWDASKDLPNGFKCTNVLVTCRDSRVNAESNRYMIVDLSAGADATKYSITYTDAAPVGGWTEEYMTTKLVLRRIEPGSFYMGSPLSDASRADNEDRHFVTLTRPYYIGVFELTAKQFSLICGGEGADTKPVEKDWYTLRGVDLALNETYQRAGDAYYKSNGQPNSYTWPFSDEVEENSLMGRLRSRTGLRFDLPTEAEWERACRAGTLGPYYTGTLDESVVKERIQGEPKLDSTGTHYIYVGLYLPNAYGLYDMQGNVQEWCLDIYADKLGTESVVDPFGGENMSTNTFRYHWDFGGGSGNLYFDLNGYQRVIRGGAVRSATRTSGLVLNTNGDMWKQYSKDYGKSYENPVSGVRLAVHISE